MALKDTWVDKIDDVDDVSAEDINAIAKQAIDNADAIDGIQTPYIGENGNWFIYDAATKIYVDSGKPSQGEQGEQGPQGQQGEKGYTPQKGTDYYTEEEKQEIIDGALDKSVAKSGNGENSVILNDFELNGAEGEYSLAEGQGTLSGLKAFVITTPLTTSEGDGVTEWALDSVKGLETGDVCSILFMTEDYRTEVWQDCGNITYINTNTKEISLTRSDGAIIYPHKPNDIFTMAFLAVLEKPNIGTVVTGNWAHSEGRETKAIGDGSHTEGGYTIAGGRYSHSEGNTTKALNAGSHAEGTGTIAKGVSSHTEGNGTEASGGNSHAEGYHTKAIGTNQHVQGRWNIDSDQYAHIVGNGTEEARSNAHTLDWDGNAWFKGEVYVGGEDAESGERLVKFSEANDLDKRTKQLQYYGDADIEPSDESLFVYEINDNGESCTIIGFTGTDIENIVIPYERDELLVTSIGDSAFSSCSSLTSITIPDSVTSIGANAFYFCSGLTNITIPGGVMKISNGAFLGCSSLTSVAMGNGVANIVTFAFRGCSNLTSVVMPVTITNIDGYAFYQCPNLRKVYYEGTPTEWSAITVGNYNSSLTNANIHFGYVDDGYYATSEEVGDIETALDSILAMQNELIGGDSV